MGFALSKIFNWLKPKSAPAPVAPPPPPPVLTLPNLYQAQEADILPQITEQLKNGATLKGSIALHGFCEKGWVDAAKLLLDSGADVNALLSSQYIHRGTPFLAAAGSCNPGLMEELLKRGADATAKDDAGHNATYHFIMDRNYDYKELMTPEGQARDRKALQILLDKGLEMEPVMEHFVYNERRHLAGMLPKVDAAVKFDAAVKGRDYGTVYDMMAAGMKPDVGADFSGQAALCIAAGQNDLKMMGMLMAAGADIHRYSRHFDALHAAAITGSRDAFVKLVGAGVETDGERYAYDRYEDTTIVEVAAMCTADTGMKAFVEDVLSRKEEIKAGYAATKEDFLHPYNHVSVETDHKVAVHRPLHIRRPASPSAS